MTKARDLANAGTALTTVSATELGYLDGVTSAVQTQIDAKEPTLPSQSGNSGKYLTTDGTSKSWGTVAGGSMTLLSTTMLSSSTVTISSISQAYKDLKILILAPKSAASTSIKVRFNLATAFYTGAGWGFANAVSASSLESYSETGFNNFMYSNSVDTTAWELYISGYSSTTNFKPFRATGGGKNAAGAATSAVFGGSYPSTSAISEVTLLGVSSAFTGGTCLIYGVN